MIALVGAMFVAMGSASAATTYPACEGVGNDGDVINYLTVGDSCALTLPANSSIMGEAVDVTDEAGSGGDQAGILAEAQGSATIVDGQGTEAEDDDEVTHRFVVRGTPSISISFGDTDDLVGAGSPVTVTVTTMGISADHTVRVTAPAPVFIDAVDLDNSGAFYNDADPPEADTGEILTGSTQFATTGEHQDDLTEEKYVTTVRLSTASVPVGTYEVTAAVTETVGNISAGTTLSTTKELRVGDPGSALDSATLSLGVQGNPDANPDNDVPEGGQDGRTGEINVVLTSLNSLGAKSNSGDVQDIRIVAPFAKLRYWDGDSFEPVTDNKIEASATTNEMVIEVTSEGMAARMVDVYAIVLGRASTATTETLTLAFTGDPETHSVSEPADALARENDVYSATNKTGGLTFEVTGADKSGNSAALTVVQVSAMVRDADGKNVSSKFTIAEAIKAPGTTSGVVLVRVGTGSSKLDAGTYTLETKLANKDTQTTEFSVAGVPATVDLMVETSTDEIGLATVITVTATVTDKDGTHVSDGSFVDFGTGGSLELRPVGKATNVTTNDGVATARFVVSKGTGLAVIIVDASDTAADGDVDASGTASVSSAPVEAMPEEEASVACLSNLNGFATWACGVESSASEIFGLVSGRGATALHLWNGSAWVRYSVVDGTMVPGSSDFMVAENDILYISN